MQPKLTKVVPQTHKMIKTSESTQPYFDIKFKLSPTVSAASPRSRLPRR